MSKTGQEFKIEEVTELLDTPLFDQDEQDKFDEESKIELYRLNDCCINQVDFIMYYSSNYELAVAEEARLKAAVERAYAELDPQARVMLESGGIKPTEGKVDATIKTNIDYIFIQTKYLAAQKNTGMWKAARDAAMHRKDMLIQIAANYRAENTGEVSINQNMKVAKEVLKRSNEKKVRE